MSVTVSVQYSTVLLYIVDVIGISKMSIDTWFTYLYSVGTQSILLQDQIRKAKDQSFRGAENCWSEPQVLVRFHGFGATVD